jgi:hypothetical protein
MPVDISSCYACFKIIVNLGPCALEDGNVRRVEVVIQHPGLEI